MSFALLLLLYSLLRVGGCQDALSTGELNQMVEQLQQKLLTLEGDKHKLIDVQSTLLQEVDRLTSQLNEMACSCTKLDDKPDSCTDVRLVAMPSGVRTLNVGGNDVNVYCDQTTSGGGWTVFQKRFDGSVDFNQSYAAYENGFGDLSREHWLGLRNVHRMTSTGLYTLEVDLEDYSGNTSYAQYSVFRVNEPEDRYSLIVSDYLGIAGSGGILDLTYHNNKYFTAKDRDNDGHRDNCAATSRKGGFWFPADCGVLNPNGLYKKSASPGGPDSMAWYPWRQWQALKRVEMKFRPK